MKTTVEEGRLNLGGLTIHYLTAGNSNDDEPPLLLLHGDGESALDWAWVIPILAATHRVYAPDFPGAGDSSKPDVVYSPEFYTQFVADFLDTLGLRRVVVVGNSLGGQVALRFALSYPEAVAALVLVSSSGLGELVNPFLSQLTLLWYGEAAIAWSKTPLGAKQRAWSRAALLFADLKRIPAEWLTEQERMALMPGFLEANLSSLRTQLNLFGQYKILLDFLPQLQMPTLVIWGTRDQILPKAQAENAIKRLQKGQLVLIPDCGHLPQIELPGLFASALLEFLDKITC
ncbi:alpha/beta fold hydrolase [Chlorogloeopsis sp. ULAP01]|uniref:alpha/beta fold hydrolase n=1 Tax=Chlorogloeopsis sp. ULAP01 TaxID=3056483 RepID=UPI0025AB34CD|nr:alpha/beta fold hydrolase [Chlorogloeopsis sp. ULAP01]MDM9380367.1 alpha/beta fold hydrolase [Chlorogloeopsis sp. ULAP01]